MLYRPESVNNQPNIGDQLRRYANEAELKQGLDYISSYWGRIIKHYVTQGLQIIPQKAQAQFILQNAGLGDPNTRLVVWDDFETIAKILDNFRSLGHINPWVGTVIKNDHADPLATLPRENAMLWTSGYNPEAIAAYAEKHPELVLKMFPQDNDGLTVGRMIAAKDGITIQLRNAGLNARESESGNRVMTFIIRRHPTSPEQWLLFCNPKVIRFIQPFINHAAKFDYLEIALRKYLPSLSLVNPEFMISGLNEPTQATLAFFTDCIWGETPNHGDNEFSSIAQILQAIPNMNVLPSWAQFIERSLDPDVEDEETGTIGRLLREALDGNPPRNPYHLYLATLLQYLELTQSSPDSTGFLRLFTEVAKRGSYFIPGSRPNLKRTVQLPYDIQEACKLTRSPESLAIIISQYPTVKQLLTTN